MIDEKKERMMAEAFERMELLEIDEKAVNLFKAGSLTRIDVDNENLLVRSTVPEPEDLEVVRRAEERYGCLVYYIIKDKGMWPDGCTFDRYTLPYVSKYESDYKMEKEGIVKLGMLPAYVANMEDPECSEISAFRFENVEGLIVNLT